MYLRIFQIFSLMQLYAPTTLAPARDFWLLRYTSVLEDGSLVVRSYEEIRISFHFSSIPQLKFACMCLSITISFCPFNSFLLMMYRCVSDLLKILKMVQPCLQCSISLGQKCCLVDTSFDLVKGVVQSYTLLITWIWRLASNVHL